MQVIKPDSFSFLPCTMRGVSIRFRYLGMCDILVEHNMVKYLLEGVDGRPSRMRVVVYNGEMTVLRTSPWHYGHPNPTTISDTLTAA